MRAAMHRLPRLLDMGIRLVVPCLDCRNGSEPIQKWRLARGPE